MPNNSRNKQCPKCIFSNNQNQEIDVDTCMKLCMNAKDAKKVFKDFRITHNYIMVI